MDKIENPCDKCKRSKCPDICRPKQDYGRALHKLAARKLPKLKEPVRLDYTWYEPARRRDWDNIMAAQKFVQDALVDSHKLDNDGWNNICGIHHEFRIDKNNPRCVVTITDADVED